MSGVAYPLLAVMVAAFGTGICVGIVFVVSRGFRAEVGRAGLQGRRGPTCLQGGTEVLTVMRLAARLMPPAAGRRWLNEAKSCLYEADPEQRAVIGRDYRRTALLVIATAWADALARGSRALTRRRNV